MPLAMTGDENMLPFVGHVGVDDGVVVAIAEEGVIATVIGESTGG